MLIFSAHSDLEQTRVADPRQPRTSIYTKSQRNDSTGTEATHSKSPHCPPLPPESRMIQSKQPEPTLPLQPVRIPQQPPPSSSPIPVVQEERQCQCLWGTCVFGRIRRTFCCGCVDFWFYYVECCKRRVYYDTSIEIPRYRSRSER